MVVYILYCKADLEGIAELTLSANTNLCFSVRNPQDSVQIREKIVVDPTVLHNSALSHHTKHRDEAPHNFAMKWGPGSDTRATVRILGANSELVNHYNESTQDEVKVHRKNKKSASDSLTSGHANALSRVRSMKGDTDGVGDNGALVPMLALDCNGLEPYAFHPLGGEGEFTAIAKSGKTYNVDLSDGDWSEYELSTGSVSIMNFEGCFR